MNAATAALLLALAHAGEPPAAPPPAPEPAKMELSIEETSVATVGTWRVALAKTWEEKRADKAVPIAWLSVVEKGSDAGPKDLELTVGETFTLGAKTFEVTAVKLAGAETGSVGIREK